MGPLGTVVAHRVRIPHFTPFEGMPASLGPGLRTASGAKRRRDGNSTIVCPDRACLLSTENSPKNSKTQLAVAIAQGETAAEWARKNNVPKRTAQRWAREPEVRAAVESIRRRALDRAVGLMSRHAKWATNGILKLGESAASESVRLAALRAVLSDMMAVSKFGGLEDRMTEIEEQIRDRTRNADRRRLRRGPRPTLVRPRPS